MRVRKPLEWKIGKGSTRWVIKWRAIVYEGKAAI